MEPGYTGPDSGQLGTAPTMLLWTFQEVGGEARALRPLSKMTMEKSKSVRRYGQRVKALIQKLTTNCSKFPDRVVYCRVSRKDGFSDLANPTNNFAGGYGGCAKL